jgi:ABC-type lipoprotein release transport system permease subunit
MSKLPLVSVFKIILSGRSSFRFLIGIILSFAFSIAVILATIGLMDGFDKSLKKALGNSNGHLSFTSKNGFYSSSLDIFKDNPSVVESTNILQVESFAIVDEQSTGVLLKGIDSESFSKVTNLNIKDLGDGVGIGSQFSKKHNLKVGDQLVMAFASKRVKDQGSAILKAFSVKQIVTHGIYEKDLRYFYINKSKISTILGYDEDLVNLGLLLVNNPEDIEKVRKKLQMDFFDDFRFQTYWQEFEVLIEAVELEKFSISMILQLIVIVAILNVVAFVIFIFEVKSQDIFMLRALGLSFRAFRQFWAYQLFFIWSSSCILSLVLIKLFEDVILEIPALQIPGDIYVLNKLEIVLDGVDYFYVFGVSLLWILLIGFVTIQKLKKKSIVSGLRQEFS